MGVSWLVNISRPFWNLTCWLQNPSQSHTLFSQSTYFREVPWSIPYSSLKYYEDVLLSVERGRVKLGNNQLKNTKMLDLSLWHRRPWRFSRELSWRWRKQMETPPQRKRSARWCRRVQADTSSGLIGLCQETQHHQPANCNLSNYRVIVQGPPIVGKNCHTLSPYDSVQFFLQLHGVLRPTEHNIAFYLFFLFNISNIYEWKKRYGIHLTKYSQCDLNKTCKVMRRQKSCCGKYCSLLGWLASVKQHLGKVSLKKLPNINWIATCFILMFSALHF